MRIWKPLRRITPLPSLPALGIPLLPSKLTLFTLAMFASVCAIAPVAKDVHAYKHLQYAEMRNALRLGEAIPVNALKPMLHGHYYPQYDMRGK